MGTNLFFYKTNDYLNLYLKKQLCRSDNTISSYKNNLSKFFDYITNICKIQVLSFYVEDCTYQFLLEYKEYMHSLNYSPKTINSSIATIRSYVKYLANCDISYMQIYLSIKGLPSAKEEKLIKPIVYPDGLKALFSAPPDTKKGNRDRTILLLLHDTAMRVNELSHVQMGDIRVVNSRFSIDVHGKGRKERTIILSQDVAKHLEKYISAFHGDNYSANTPLFYTTIDGKIKNMTNRNIQLIVKKYGALAKKEAPSVPNNVHPHMLRRSRATQLYQDGVHLSLVSTFLGHAQMETTRSYYAFPSTEQLRQATESIYDSEKGVVWNESSLEALKKRFGLD